MSVPFALFLLVLIFACQSAFSQSASIKLDDTQLQMPAVLPLHPLGIFSLRLADDFRMAPPASMNFNIGISSGNCWSPPVTVYIPTEDHVIKRMRGTPWHQREYSFDIRNNEYQKLEYAADGVLREFRLDFQVQVRPEHEIGVTSRAYYLGTGEAPVTLLCNDQFIEWFHSEIYKDPDPFARKKYNYNQAGIRFQDQEGREMELAKGSFFIPATELRYIYYPRWLSTDRFSVKATIHAGLNHHTYNTSVDGGFSVAGIKSFRVTDRRSLQVGMSPGVVRRQLIISGKNENVSLIEAQSGFTLQGIFRYNWLNKNNSTNSLILSFHNQSAYYTNDKNQDFWVLTGNRYTSHWAVTIHHLFRNLQAWTLAYQFTRKWSFMWYIQEDLLVNNGPDIQTGISVGIPIANVSRP